MIVTINLNPKSPYNFACPDIIYCPKYNNTKVY